MGSDAPKPSLSWPALGREEHEWVPATASFGVQAALGTRPTSTYRAAVPPLIGALMPEVAGDVAAEAEEATNELSRFDAELGERVAGFAPVLLRSESSSSSQIENLTASARQIFAAELGAKTGQNAALVAANTRALQAALDLSSDVTAEKVNDMHRVLMAATPRHTPGRYRDEQVWIGARADSPHGASFVPPHHTRIAPLMDDVVQFARRWDVPALTSVAITHAQFETIHPYTDGNGRTGRALAQSMLRYRRVTRNVAVPVSAGLLADVEGYHEALTAYREGDVNPIVHAFAVASMRAVDNSRQLVRDIDDIKRSWTERLQARRDSHAWKLLDVLSTKPVIDAATAASALGIQRPNVYPPLRALVEAGVAQSKAEHELGPFWRSDEILRAIDDFAARAGRRSRP